MAWKKDASLSTVSQLLSSASSIILSIGAARSLELTQFGIFAIVFAGVALSLGIIRAYTAELYMYRYSGSTHPIRPVLGAAVVLLFPVLLLAVMAFVGQAAGLFGLQPDMSRASLWILIGAVAIASVVQDQTRFLLIALRRPRTSMFAEMSALIAVLLGFAVLGGLGASGLPAVMMVWTLSTAVAAAIGTFAVGGPAGPRSSISWLRDHKREGTTYLFDFLLTNGVSNGIVFLVASVSGVAASGALRGAQVLLAPVLLVTRGASVSLAPEFRKASQDESTDRLQKLGIGFSVAVLFMVIITMVGGWLLPMDIIDFALGESAQASMRVLPAAAVATGFMGVAIGAGMILRVQGRVETAFRIKLVCAPVLISASIAGTVWAGAAGSQAGVAVGEAMRSIMSWTSVRKSHARGEAS